MVAGGSIQTACYGSALMGNCSRTLRSFLGVCTLSAGALLINPHPYCLHTPGPMGSGAFYVTGSQTAPVVVRVLSVPVGVFMSPQPVRCAVIRKYYKL